jgi:hypothetical protein
LVLLIVALLIAGPLPVLAATPDPVLEWIGIMDTTVRAGGTNPLTTSRVLLIWLTQQTPTGSVR